MRRLRPARRQARVGLPARRRRRSAAGRRFAAARSSYRCRCWHRAPGRSFVLHSATRFRVGAAGCRPQPRDDAGDALAQPARVLPRALRVALASGQRRDLAERPGPAACARAPRRSARCRPATPSCSAGTAPGARGGDRAARPRRRGLAGGAPLRGGGLRARRSGAVHVRAALALAPFLADVGRLASVSAGLQRGERPGGRLRRSRWRSRRPPSRSPAPAPWTSTPIPAASCRGAWRRARACTRAHAPEATRLPRSRSR